MKQQVVPMWLNLRVWWTGLVPTPGEVRTGLLAGGITFLVVVALSPLVTLLAKLLTTP